MGDIIRWPKHLAYHCPPGCPSCEIDACPTQVLFTCATCGATEEELATECPGYRVHDQELAAVMNGHLDFRSGRWIAVVVSKV